VSTYVDEAPVHNPAAIEQKIEEIANRIAKGVSIVTVAERDSRAKKRDFDLAYAIAYKESGGPAHERRYTADIETMALRADADNAEITFKHAERTAKALEKELLAWQSINGNVRAMYGAVRA
jgi:hypothetical protein